MTTEPKYTPAPRLSQWTGDEITAVFIDRITPPDGIPADWILRLYKKSVISTPEDIFSIYKYPDILGEILGLSQSKAESLASTIAQAMVYKVPLDIVTWVAQICARFCGRDFNKFSGYILGDRDLFVTSLVSTTGAKDFSSFVNTMLKASDLDSPVYKALSTIEVDEDGGVKVTMFSRNEIKNMIDFIRVRHGDLIALVSKMHLP